MPGANYRSVTLNDQLVQQVQQLIRRTGTYHSIAEFVSEAVRLRLEVVEKQCKTEEGKAEDGS
jgi:Arc/MetJ-type ribon-helix-helix transcriptional regulator